MNSVVLKNVIYSYPLTNFDALHDINYTFEQGKFYGIIGPNGSGKSTLCYLIKGLIPSFYHGELKGKVVIFGKDVSDWDLNELTTKIGYISQNPFTQISGVKDTVFEEIAIGLENLGIPKNEMIERILETVKLIGIEDLIRLNPNELSGGQRQRVAFASIIAMDTDIYVIDEPTSQLDPDGTESIFEIIETLKKNKKTIILVEHKVDLLAQYADEIIVMHEGRIIDSGPTKNVLQSYSLLDKGVILPQTVLLSKEMEQAGKKLNDVPITIEEAYNLITKWRKE